MIRGYYFDENTWDSKDIFCPEKTSFIFVNEKVKKILEGNKVANIKFQKIIETERHPGFT